MSMTDLDLFPSESDAMREPQFSTTRNGYNPREVDGFLARMADQIETMKGQVQRLERGLRQAQAESESARQRYAAAKAEVYEEFAARMAELLRTADLQAEKVRREADEAVAKQLAEAGHQAEKTIRDATMESEHLKWEGQEALKRAKTEAEKVVQEITVFRRSVRGELQSLHDRLVTVVEELGATIQIPEPEPATISSLAPAEPPQPEPRGEQQPPAEVVPDQPAATAAGPTTRQEDHPSDTGGVSGGDTGVDTEETKLSDSPGWTDARAHVAPETPEAQGSRTQDDVATTRDEDVEADDLLSTVQGFDLVLPEFGEEPEEGS